MADGVYTATLKALRDLWGAQSELVGVAFQQVPPLDSIDLDGGSGHLEAVWLGDASVSREVPTMRAGVVEFEETWSIDWVVQVLIADDPVNVIDRCERIHRACVAALQADARAGLTAPSWRRYEVVADDDGGEFTHGPWRGDIYAARFEDSLTVVARVDSDSP